MTPTHGDDEQRGITDGGAAAITSAELDTDDLKVFLENALIDWEIFCGDLRAEIDRACTRLREAGDYTARVVIYQEIRRLLDSLHEADDQRREAAQRLADAVGVVQ